MTDFIFATFLKVNEMTKIISVISTSLVLLVSSQAQAFQTPVLFDTCGSRTGECTTLYLKAQTSGNTKIRVYSGATARTTKANVNHKLAFQKCGGTTIYTTPIQWGTKSRDFSINTSDGSGGLRVKVFSYSNTKSTDEVIATGSI